MKFIHLYLFVVLTSLSFGLFGQSTVTVGTGTSTDYNFPIQPYFNYGWTSQIYTSAEIGTSGVLNSIAFYINNSSGSYTLDNQKIYMRQTSASQHVDKNYPGTTGFTLVYSGSITIGASGWKTITLTTPFTYSNSSNLEILIESRDGSTFTSAVQTRYTSKSEYRTKYDYNDYAFPTTWYAGGRVTKLPNIQFVINTCTAVAGSVSTTTSTICAGNTASLTLNGQTAGQNIQWQESTDNLTFTDIIGASSTTSTTFTTPALTSIKYYRAKVGSGSCIVYSNVQTISVTALPATPTSTNNGPLCAGSTLNLTASTITGATYAWTGPNSFTSTSQNPSIATITTAGAGTYSVTASVNGCTSVAGITSVTVNNYPTNVSISASATTVTSGTSVTLTASGATNYNWDNGLGTGAVKTVTTTSSTTYTVIADNGNSCKDTTSITIDVTNSSNTGVTTSTVTIGTGTATDYSIPLQSYFNYGWSSQLYLASELQGGGFLNSLSFYVTNSGASYTLDNQKIYVRHTTDASFADKNYPGTTGFTLVYDGPITISSTGWKTIPFSTPFNYNGTSNLEVLVESRDGSTFTSTIQTRYTNQSGTSIYRTKYDYNNDAFPSTYYQGGRIHHYANIQFNKTVCNLATPVIKTNSPVCEGTTLILSTDTLAGATYSWTGPNGFTSNLQNPVFSSSATTLMGGKYSVKINLGICSKNSDSSLVIVGTKPITGVILGQDSICENSSFMFTNNTTGGIWSVSDTSIARISFLGNLTTKKSGVFYVRYTKVGANGCPDSTVTKMTTVIKKSFIGNVNYPYAIVENGKDSIIVDSVLGKISWLVSTDGANFTEVLNQHANKLILSAFDSTRYYQVSVKNLSCAVTNSSSLKINIFKPIKLETTDSLLNKGDTLQIMTNIDTVGYKMQWQKLTNATFTDINGTTKNKLATDTLTMNTCFRLKVFASNFVTYSDTQCIQVLKNILGVDTFYVTTKKMGSSGSLDIIVPKVVASANQGNKVYMVYAVPPNDMGNALIPYSPSIPSIDNIDGEVYILPSRSSIGVQGIDFTTNSVPVQRISSFFGRSFVQINRFTVFSNTIVADKKYYELKNRLDGEVYNVGSSYNALSLACDNYSASSKYSYIIYNQNHKSIQKGEVTLKNGRNSFIIEFKNTMVGGIYTVELIGPKGDKKYCKYYTGGYRKPSDDSIDFNSVYPDFDPNIYFDSPMFHRFSLAIYE